MADVYLFAEDVGLASTVDHVTAMVVHREVAGTANDWLAAGIEHTVRWEGERSVPSRPRVRYTDDSDRNRITRELGDVEQAGGLRIKTRGFFAGAPGKPGAATWRKALIAASAREEPDAIVVATDTDGDPTRLAGLRQARDFMVERNPDACIVIAAPHPEVEAWWVGGYRASNPGDTKRIMDLKKELSFDPTKHPHRLTSSPNTAPTDAKRVARILLLNEDKSAPLNPIQTAEACTDCLTDLDEVSASEHTGLNAFREEIRSRLLPMLTA